MTARIDSVCRAICENGQWRVSNLQIQKILYLVQMVHMGRNHGKSLFSGAFEAWDYGPVEPDVYRRVRMFGAGPIQNVFFNALAFRVDDVRKALIDEVCVDLLRKKPGELVEITHWEKGAWATHYEPGTKGIKIPDSDIFKEYTDRIASGKFKDNNTAA